MKLYLNATSPFARWVLVCALEWGIENLELVWVDPWAVPDQLCQVNPFATVPVLQTDQGEALYESSVIVRYLLPAAIIDELPGLQRWALGKMLLETAFRYVSWQRYQPSDGLDHPLLGRTYQTLERVLSTLTAADLPPAPERSPDLASLQLAVGLDYLAWRCPALVTGCLPTPLSDRLASYQARSSFRQTRPTVLAPPPQ
jgi:glutathione S-transferase